MNDRSLSDRLLERKVAEQPEPDAVDDLGAFGMLRGSRDRSLMLDFRLKGGNSETFPYAALDRIRVDPSEGIVLEFNGVVVTLKGWHLARATEGRPSLAEGLRRQRVAWIQEVDALRGALRAPEIMAVTEIRIKG